MTGLPAAAAAPADLGLSFPMLWECKTMADKHWKACTKSGVAVTCPVYAAQMATYQAYMEGTVPGISRNPALFTAILVAALGVLARYYGYERAPKPRREGSTHI